MADLLTAPLETDFEQEGATLVNAVGLVLLLPAPYIPLVAPENFTDYQTPQGGSTMAFG
ncbi:MAG: hypothetical protein ACREPX_08280 [Rhodanobacteraceae bacterium]